MLIELALVFIVIGAAAFGGGITALSLIIHEVVQKQQWLSPDQMKSIVTISQMTPGPIGLNSATFTGFTVSGIAGSVIATLSLVLPGLLGIVLFRLLVKLHTRITDGNNGHLGKKLTDSLKPGIFALIVFAVWTIGSTAIHGAFTAIIAGLAFVVILVLPKMHPLVVIIVSGLAGVIFL